MKISLIVAIGSHGVIGNKNKLPWHVSEDLKNFKRLTLGHHILMGRKTFESIGKILPQRTTLILSQNKKLKREGAITVFSLQEAFDVASKNGETELFICGGANVYEQAFPLVKTVYLSKMSYEGLGDAFLNLDLRAFKKIEEKSYPDWTYEVWERS